VNGRDAIVRGAKARRAVSASGFWRPVSAAWLLGIVGVSALGGCGVKGSGAAAVPTAPLDLVVLHTNDGWGEVDPCG
jgi:hypothetical protein